MGNIDFVMKKYERTDIRVIKRPTYQYSHRDLRTALDFISSYMNVIRAGVKAADHLIWQRLADSSIDTG